MRLLLAALVVLALPADAQNYSADPLYGTARLRTGFQPDPHVVSVRAGGGTANPIDGPGCVGYIAAGQPDVNVAYTAGRTFSLGFMVESRSDTALLIRAPDGRWGCDDDSGDGLNPAFVLSDPPSGTYNVWVATFGEDTAEADLMITEVLRDDPDDKAAGRSDLPNWRADPLYADVVLQNGFTPDPYRTGVLAGGSDPNPIDQPGCVGYVAASQPDVNVTYAAGSEWDLEVFVESASDTALLIRDPRGGWHCDDDSGDGLNPLVTFAMPASGTYNVWVATFGESAADATLNVSEAYRSAPAPDHRAFPLSGRIELASGFTPDPYEVGITAGGPDENPIDGPGCVGYIAASQPDLVVDYTAGTVFDLYFNVHGDADTTLLVRAPDGRWICDDDSGEGLDPRVHVPTPPSGAYAIWVGTYGDSLTGSVLRVSELDR